jgi:hypothetical protein
MPLNLRNLALGIFSLAAINLQAQSSTQLTLDSFTNNTGTWSSVAEVSTNPLTSKELSGSGKGAIMLNQPTKKNPGTDIISSEIFGDVDLKMTYMMGEGSNSGVYLQGQYEVQLYDSWKETTPRAGGNGGVYERWDESKPDGQKGYQGYAARQNVSKAPGVWQNLEVSFRAPRFDAAGKKTENARFRHIKLNGVTIHEDLELFGPTRGALKATDVATGPIRIQGDHGPVAIKSLEVMQMNFPEPTVGSISYTVYPGSFTEFPELENLKPATSGKIASFEDFKTGVSGPTLTKFEGALEIKKAGNYTLNVMVPEGLGAIQIGSNSDKIILNQYTSTVQQSFEAGNTSYTIWVSKPRDWSAQGFEWTASNVAMWPVALSSPAIAPGYFADPIWVDTEATPVLRSFVRLPSGKSLSHAVSVSSKAGAHFTYDLSSHQLIRVWRGGFLDATPMWNDRGNGMSLPLGVVTNLNQGKLLIQNADEMGLKSTGYSVQGDGDILFTGMTDSGNAFSDHLKLNSDGTGLERSIQLAGTPVGTSIQVAEGGGLKKISDTIYLIEESGLYLRVADKGMIPTQMPTADGQGIFLPFNGNLSYSLLF